MKRFDAKIAGKILICLLFMMIIFHLLIIIKILPQNIVWGGHLEESEVLQFEWISVIITVIFSVVIWLKLKQLQQKRNSKFLNLGLWIMFAYFIFNIIANLSAETSTETYIFTPLSILLAFLVFRLAIEN